MAFGRPASRGGEASARSSRVLDSGFAEPSGGEVIRKWPVRRGPPLYEKALEIHRRLLTDDHPDTAKSYGNLAVNLNAQGKYAEAQPLYEKALEIHRRLLGNSLILPPDPVEHPNARVCSAVPLHASAEVEPSARIRFSPLRPETTQTRPPPTAWHAVSPIDQPVRGGGRRGSGRLTAWCPLRLRNAGARPDEAQGAALITGEVGPLSQAAVRLRRTQAPTRPVTPKTRASEGGGLGDRSGRPQERKAIQVRDAHAEVSDDGGRGVDRHQMCRRREALVALDTVERAGMLKSSEL